MKITVYLSEESAYMAEVNVPDGLTTADSIMDYIMGNDDSVNEIVENKEFQQGTIVYLGFKLPDGTMLRGDAPYDFDAALVK